MYKKILVLMMILSFDLDASSLPKNLLLGTAAISAMTIFKTIESEHKAHAYEELLQDRGENIKNLYYQEFKPKGSYLDNIIDISFTAQVVFAGLIYNDMHDASDIAVVGGMGIIFLGCSCALAYYNNSKIDDAIKKTEEISEAELEVFYQLV